MTPEQERGIRLWYDLCKDNKELVEIRAIDPVGGKVYSGYFQDADTIISELKGYEHCNIYWTLNDIDESCSSRLQRNKMMYKTKESTSDRDITGYRFILCDIDCERPAGVASSDEEFEYAKKKANEVYAFLRQENFSEPIVICSGSGVHLLYRVKLQNTPERQKLVKDFLDTLGMLFSDDKVHIDGVVGNLSRISRMPYFMNRKGCNTEQRPHRMAYIVKAPDVLKKTAPEYIERITALLPQPEQPSRSNHYQSASAFDLDEFIQKYDIKIAKRIKTPQCEKLILAECPFNSNHKAPDSAIFVFPNNAIAFRCLHASDSHFTWRDVRLHYDPHSYDKQTYNEYVHKRNYYGAYHPQVFVPEEETAAKGKVWLEMHDIKDVELNPNDFFCSGIPTLDKYIIGFKRKQVSVWTGRQASGKSTLLSQLILYSVQRGHKVALWTAEMAQEEIRQWMMLQASGKAFTKQSQYNSYYYVPKHIKPKIEEWMRGKFFLYNNDYSANALNIIDKIRKVHAEHKVSQVWIDNLMMLDLEDLDGKNELSQQKRLLKSLCDLAKELDCHIHLIAHPNKERVWLDVASVCGSSNIGNMAMNVFLLSKIYRETFEQQASQSMSKQTIQDILDSKCSSILQIGKCRNKGSAIGKVIKLWFEEESNRLKSDPYENIVLGWADEPQQMDMPLDPIVYDNADPFNNSDFLTTLPSEDIPF